MTRNANHPQIGYIKKEVAAVIGVKPSLIQFYTEKGIINPGINAPKGKGTRRRYSTHNVLEIALIHRMTQNGLPLKVAKILTKSLVSKIKTPTIAILKKPVKFSCSIKFAGIESEEYHHEQH